MNDTIFIEGAEEHNLKNIDVRIPKNKLVVITGLSGSGKSSLAFDTIYAEGQRRYLESFSPYARQFMGTLKRPKLRKITGLSPVVAIEQKTISKNLRSTVGTITEVYDFMRLLFARIGVAYSYHTNKPMQKFSEEEMITRVKTEYANQSIRIFAPLVQSRKGHYRELFTGLGKKGYTRVRVNGTLREIEEGMRLPRYGIHNIELLIDTVEVTPKTSPRMQQALKTALELGKGLLFIIPFTKGKKDPPLRIFSKEFVCVDTGLSYATPSPNTFSFNTPTGYCPLCKGLGIEECVDEARVIYEDLSIAEGALLRLTEENNTQSFRELRKLAQAADIPLHTPFKQLSAESRNTLLYGNKSQTGLFTWIENAYKQRDNIGLYHWAAEFMKALPCPSCEGARLKKESLYFKIQNYNIFELSELSFEKLHAFFQDLPRTLIPKSALIAKDIIQEIQDRIGFLLDVGLAYLKPSLPARALSGGEAQRVRLSTQVGAGLRGITYILDEPSIGLHQRDNHKLIKTLKKLRDLGNSVIVVEHDRDIMLAADYILDLGPGAGKQGGEIIGSGSPKEFIHLPHSETALFLKKAFSKTLRIPRKGNGKILSLLGARGNNLKGGRVDFPLGKFIVVSGISGSGKSSLINDTLFPALYTLVHKIKKYTLPYEEIIGASHIQQVIQIDQSPIGRIPRSNPATYCGFFTEIRSLFASLPEARARAYPIGRFSFNVKGGRCEACGGVGFNTLEMGFLPAVHVPCAQCQGRRYNRATLDIRYKGKSINDVLNMSVDEAVIFFQAIPHLHRRIQILQDVGMGYLRLGHTAVLLSGGEAQRVKLCTELGKKNKGNALYILDEPTTGLHCKDIDLLLHVLDKLVDKGNTVVVIEHNMDVITHADYIIDMGPEGGEKGGEIIACGSVKEMIAHTKISATAAYLAKELHLPTQRAS